jgi:FixJ family two-component response regulator
LQLTNFRCSDVLKRKLVLIVDDDAALRRSLARLLHQLGYDSLLFASTQAIEDRTYFDDVLCVLLDIDLGDGSGIELKRAFNAAGVTVPVIYMTGSDTPAVREAALQSGCVAYLAKPFSVNSLIEALLRAAEPVEAHGGYP